MLVGNVVVGGECKAEISARSGEQVMSNEVY